MIFVEKTVAVKTVLKILEQAYNIRQRGKKKFKN
jgi:hypothetical protein